MTVFQKIVLGIAAIVAMLVGVFILFDPHSFYQGYDFALGQNPNMLSELRAPAANLFLLGMLMLSGVFLRSLFDTAFIVAIVVFGAFAFGRLVSIVFDGVPSGSILGALAIEAFIAVLLFVAYSSTFAKKMPAKGLKN